MNKLLASFFLLMSCFFLATLPLEAKELTDLTSENHKQILDGNKYVVIDVYTDWCGPCRSLAPIFKELNDEMGDKYKFVKLNAEQQTKIADFFKIQAYPTILFIKEGKEVGRILGFRDKKSLVSEIENRFR